MAEKNDDKPAEDKPAERNRSSAKKPTTIAMHQPATGRTWEAGTHAEAAELLALGWKWDDTGQDTSEVPYGFTGPGKDTPTGGRLAGDTAS